MRNILNKLTKGFLTAAMAVAAMPVFGQDKLASMAPVDKKMRAVDSVAIIHLLNREMDGMLENPAAELYPDWNNEYTSGYNVELPAEFKIDMRNFCMPTTRRKVTSHFGYRRSFRRRHYGTDIKVYIGDTIRAAFSGKVRIVEYDGRGYGRYVLIRHPNGLETLYGHLSKQMVKQDQIVRAGDPIGLGGNSGRSTGSHLHFETRFLGQHIDPEKLFSFEAQDVMGDFYVYRSSGNGQVLAAHQISYAEDAIEKSMAKSDESLAFQNDKRATQMAKPRTSVHKVRKGESLSSIAKKYGTTVTRLCRLNSITTKTVLRPGQILKYG
ncbi:MAG: peptidoglycan DD-metalloendopeptidase family protein [Bacteroidaceae bacterium]|nr:peptidoglycan DD-metalloendopeptidase family protein [Bacteroidaceae bacterium]